MTEHYRSYRAFLEEKYGERVYRLGVDGGFSCPNRKGDGSGGCSFCDGTGSKAAYQRREERSFSGKPFAEDASKAVLLSRLPMEERIASIGRQIEAARTFVSHRYKARLYSLYFQAWTNTYGPVEELKQLYDAALKTGTFEELIVSTRPDEIDDEKAELLEGYKGQVKEVWVEVGLQSANDTTLLHIGRGHDTACYYRACDILHRHGLKVSTHVILGLPGEGRSDYLKTAQAVGKAGSEGVKIHNLDICGGTRLLDEFLEGEIGVPSFPRHLESTVLFLRHIPSSVVVERLLCETPSHRLAAPRSFGVKNRFIEALEETMEKNGYYEGDSYEAT